jgi:hypothetical protein
MSRLPSRASKRRGWCSASQSIAVSNVFIVASGWSAASATMPTECDPDASGMSQTQ